MILGGLFDLDNKNKEIINLNQKIEETDFWNNKELSEKVINR